MAAFRYPRTSQPQGGAALVPYAMGSVLTYADAGGRPVRSIYAPAVAGVNTRKPSLKGLARSYDGTNDGTSFASGAVVDTTKPFTLVVQFNPSSLSSKSTYAHICTLQSAQGSTPFELVVTNVGGGYKSILFGSAGVSWLQGNLSINGVIAVGTWYTVVLSYNGLGSGTLSNYSIHINGVNQTLAAGSSFSALANQTTVALPPTGGANNKFAGLITLLSVLPSVFPVALQRDLSSNPWQIFTPQPRQIWVPTAGGGVNYSLTCDAGAFTLAGQDATLTYTAGTANYTLACDAGAYVLAGQDAALTYTPGSASVAYSLLCDAGAYALAGQDATLTYVSNAPVAYSLACEAGAYSITGQEATFSFSGGSQDTHDGYWSKQWEKLRKKKPIIEEVIELVQEEPAIALAEVKEAVKREYPQVDYTQVLNNIQLQRFIAEQLIKALELRRIQDDEDDIEILLML